MPAKNQTVFDRIQSGDLISIKEAMKRLEIKSAGAFQAALKSHDYLRAAIVEKTDLHPRLIEAGAVERYRTTRGSTGGSRDGAKWYHVRVTDDQAAQLREAGYEIVKPTDRVKASTNGAASANGAASSDVELDEDELEADEEAELDNV